MADADDRVERSDRYRHGYSYTIASTGSRQRREPIAPVCQIQWIDAQGNPTPDSNPAIARVRCKAREQIIAGRVVRFDQSQWFNICAEHAAQMSNPGMEIGECETL